MSQKTPIRRVLFYYPQSSVSWLHSSKSYLIIKLHHAFSLLAACTMAAPTKPFEYNEKPGNLEARKSLNHVIPEFWENW
jgi:hypothetical protein